MVSAIEIIPDPIKHASIQTWMTSLARMKPSTVIQSQAYDKLFEIIRLDLLVNPRLVKVVDLIEKLMIYRQSMDATEISELTKEHFQKIIEFGVLLEFEDLLKNITRFLFFTKSFEGSTGQKDGIVISTIRQQE